MSERLNHLWSRYVRRDELSDSESEENLTVDEVEELLELQRGEIERLTRELEEARKAAKSGYQALGKPKSWNLGERARLLMRWPWLDREGEG